MSNSLKSKLPIPVRSGLSKVKRAIKHAIGFRLSKVPLRGLALPIGRPKVLVVGVYVTNAKHFACELSREFADSKVCSVEQRWASLGRVSLRPELAQVTKLECLEGASKFALLNKLLCDIDMERYDYILCADDDVTVQPGFLDAYIALQQKYDFSLCQPARSAMSNVDHSIVRRKREMLARQTRFVEIGPVFSFDNRIASEIVPFDLAAPMGWGLDMVWPTKIERKGLKMGIVDATPVDHTVRNRGVLYSVKETSAAAKIYSSENGALTPGEAFVEVACFKK
jgi:hypothetical protein